MFLLPNAQPREVLPRKSLKKKNLILSAPRGPAYEFMSLNQVPQVARASVRDL